MAQRECQLEAIISFLFSEFHIFESYINTFIPTGNTVFQNVYLVIQV